MKLKLAFAGFGNVAREFVRLLESRQTLLAKNYQITWQITGIATGKHGCVTSGTGLTLSDILPRLESGNRLEQMPNCLPASDTEHFIETCDADILFETTPLNYENGEPAVTYLRKAFA